MSDDKRVILEFYVNTGWDARSHRVFTYAPANWNEWDQKQRDEFLERESRQWVEEDIEIGGIAYDDPSKIDNSRWGDTYDENSVEEMFE